MSFGCHCIPFRGVWSGDCIRYGWAGLGKLSSRTEYPSFVVKTSNDSNNVQHPSHSYTSYAGNLKLTTRAMTSTFLRSTNPHREVSNPPRTSSSSICIPREPLLFHNLSPKHIYTSCDKSLTAHAQLTLPAQHEARPPPLPRPDLLHPRLQPPTNPHHPTARA